MQKAESSEAAGSGRHEVAEQLPTGPEATPLVEVISASDPKPKPPSEEEPKLEPETEAGRWFHVSDTHVTKVTLGKVLKAPACMLFHKRIT